MSLLRSLLFKNQSEENNDLEFETRRQNVEKTYKKLQDIEEAAEELKKKFKKVIVPCSKLGEDINNYFIGSERNEIYGTAFYRTTEITKTVIEEHLLSLKLFIDKLKEYRNNLTSIKKNLSERDKALSEYERMKAQFNKLNKEQSSQTNKNLKESQDKNAFEIQTRLNEAERNYKKIQSSVTEELLNLEYEKFDFFNEEFIKLKSSQAELFIKIFTSYQGLAFKTSFDYISSTFSIAQDENTHHQLLSVVQVYELSPPACTEFLFEFYGEPFFSSKQESVIFASAKSVSTYPKKANRTDGAREGDPICDQYYLRHFSNRIYFAIADGCNWGEPARLAANIACKEFIEYMSKYHLEYTDTHITASYLLEALFFSHNKICSTATVERPVGTTTLLGGAAVQLERKNNFHPGWALIFVNIGDCKLYKYKPDTKTIEELTKGTRHSFSDAKDPGGRIGPYIDGKDADLRNLQIFFSLCDEGDLIFAVTDGVSDNLDPLFSGKTPKSYGINVEGDSWDKVNKVNQQNKVFEQLLEMKYNESMNIIKREIEKKGFISTENVTNSLISYCERLTQPSREFMETNPKSKQPEDYVQYPGKMDHATIISFFISKDKQSLPSQSFDTLRDIISN